jgi:hypothetical protein
VLEQISKKRKSGWHAISGVPVISPDSSPRAPGAFSIGAVIGLAPFTYAGAREKAQHHPIAVCRPAGGLSKITRGGGVMIEMHHDANHVSCDGLTCAALKAHEFVLAKDTREEDVCFLTGMPGPC